MKIVKRKRSEHEDKVCDVKVCEEPSQKAVSSGLAVGTSLDLPKLNPRKVNRVHLCKAHAKVFKKETKEERDMDRLSRPS